MAYRGTKGNGGSNGGYESQSFLERMNDNQVDELSSKVSLLKNVSIQIGDTVRQQNRMLNDMDSDFDAQGGLLGSTMRRLGIVSRAGGHKLICYLVLFALFVFFIIYWMAKSS